MGHETHKMTLREQIAHWMGLERDTHSDINRDNYRARRRQAEEQLEQEEGRKEDAA